MSNQRNYKIKCWYRPSHMISVLLMCSFYNRKIVFNNTSIVSLLRDHQLCSLHVNCNELDCSLLLLFSVLKNLEVHYFVDTWKLCIPELDVHNNENINGVMHNIVFIVLLLLSYHAIINENNYRKTWKVI